MTALRSWRWTFIGLGSYICRMAISFTWDWVEGIEMEWLHLYGKVHADWMSILSFPEKRNNSWAATCPVPMVTGTPTLCFAVGLNLSLNSLIFFSLLQIGFRGTEYLKDITGRNNTVGWLFLPKMDEMMNECFHLHKPSAERASPNGSIYTWWHPDCNHK